MDSYKFHNRLLIVKRAFYSAIMKVLNQIKGIEDQGAGRYIGLTCFVRHPDSKISIGRHCTFNSDTTSNLLGINHQCIISAIKPNAKIEIGNYCGFSGVSISCTKSIEIHDNVRCGSNVIIMDTDGHNDDHRSGENSPIIIEDGVWIGSDCRIMKGVTIGRGSIIGLGSIVRSSIPPYAIVIGNPAKIIGFNFTPSEVVEYEKDVYAEGNRLSLEYLKQNYRKYYISRIKEIKNFILQ